MKIDEKKCVGCGNCVPYCTMGVIRIENGFAAVNEDECVECNTCYRCCESEKRLSVLVRTVRRILAALRLRYDALASIKKVTCPTLVAHSTGDEIVPFRMGRTLYEAAPTPKRFLTMRGDHNQGFLITGPAYTEAFDGFLRESLRDQ